MKTFFISISTLLIISICSFLSTAQDNAQIGLPEGAIARIGKGTLGEIHFSPDGSKLAVSTSIGIWLHDPQTGKELELLKRKHITQPYTFAYSPDGKTIASVCWGKPLRRIGNNRYTVEVWETATGKDKAIIYVGHSSSVESIVYSPDGKTIVTGAAYGDNMVHLWHAETGKSITTSRIYATSINFVVYSQDGSTFAAAGDKTVLLFDGKTGKHKFKLIGHTERVTSAAFSPDGKTIVTGSSDGTIRLWHTITGDQKTTLTSEVEGVEHLVYSPDGRNIACGTSNGDVQLWDTRTMKLKSILAGHTGAIISIVYSPDGRTIASAGSDRTVRLWDAATGNTRAILTGYMMRIDAAAYSPDGKSILTANRDNKVQVWDTQTGKIKKTFTLGDYGIIFDVAYSPDSKTIAVVWSYKDVHLLDARTGKHKATLKHFGLIDNILMAFLNREYDISSVAYSPDGSTIVTGGDYYIHEKGTVYLWDVKTGKRRRTLFKGTGGVRNVMFSEDGERIIATGDWKDEIRVWHAKTGKKLKPIPIDKIEDSKNLLYSPDGRTVTLINQDGTLLILSDESRQ